ncbi:Zona pellucida sperm-binding protein 3 [Triplophysa tibetana]|uniref:Zona pellucida sperm-binding protein 3 n=1 Tax=Triplophysa tibetana TaxID=1572043 RepID=A0A5A9PF14_9TELE|nr:Zona pellucida sperm-binding protein 3 [Triplophysa tibetana]
MMGLWQAGFGLMLVLAFGLSDAQWRGRSAQTQKPSILRPWSQMQVPQQSETRMPQSSQTNIPLLVPQRIPSQFSMQTPGVVGGKPGQDPLGVQSKQLLQGPMEKLTWTFPSPPEEPLQPEIPFELQNPLSPNSVGAQCGENSVYVEVMEDFFGTGQLLMASGFALGGCGPTGQDNNARVLIFESELHGCGSMLTMSGSFERPSNQYFLGDIVNIEASVKTYNHVPLRVFVDRCVATVSPDVNSAPRYSFIENNGCLVDAKFTGSSSRYLPRTQLISCSFSLRLSGLHHLHLKAVPVATPTDSEQKACSFSPNGWVSVDESDQGVAAVTPPVAAVMQAIRFLEIYGGSKHLLGP